MTNTTIHPTAVVHPKAKLSAGVVVGPYAIIDGEVTIGQNVQIGNHCVITGRTTIGANCTFYTGAVIGSPPQDKKHRVEDEVYLKIGENNIFREYVTVNPGTRDGGTVTQIGNDNLVMAYSHVAHDCHIGNRCVLANAATLGGHVEVEDNVSIGGFSAVHQFTRLGRLCIVGGCSKVTQDVPPFSMCDGHPAKVYGINSVGLKRANFSTDVTARIKQAFKILFRSGLLRTNALELIAQEVASCPEIEHLLAFVRDSKRGVSGG